MYLYMYDPASCTEVLGCGTFIGIDNIASEVVNGSYRGIYT